MIGTPTPDKSWNTPFETQAWTTTTSQISLTWRGKSKTNNIKIIFWDNFSKDHNLVGCFTSAEIELLFHAKCEDLKIKSADN